MPSYASTSTDADEAETSPAKAGNAINKSATGTPRRMFHTPRQPTIQPDEEAFDMFGRVRNFVSDFLKRH